MKRKVFQMIFTFFKMQGTEHEIVCDLNTDDTDWHRLNLLTDSKTHMSRNKKLKHRFKTDPDSSHTVPRCTLPKRSAVWAAAADASTVAEAAAIAELLPQQKPHGHTRNATYNIHKKCYLQDFQGNCPIRKALTFRCRP